MVKIYAVRHGQTEGNREKIYRGRWDLPLDETGRRQVRLAGEALASTGFDAILSSPLLRTRQTAEALAAGRALEIRSEPALIDLDYGSWTRRADAEVARTEGELYRLWHEQPGRVVFPGGEGLRQVRLRLEELLRRLSLQSGTMALCGHRVSVKMLLLLALGLGDEAFWRIQVDPASISILEHDGRDWKVLRVNDVCHLQALSGGPAGADF